MYSYSGLNNIWYDSDDQHQSDSSDFYESSMIDQEKWYLNVRREGQRGALTFFLTLPSFEIDYPEELSFYIGPKERK